MTVYDAAQSKYSNYEKDNKELISEFESKIDLANQNLLNGDFGRMHAQASIEQARILAHKVEENMKSESKELTVLFTKPDESGRVNMPKSESKLSAFIGAAT